MRSQCVLYCRVSTSQQAVDGIGLDAQRQRLQAWAHAHGHQVLACHVDAGISGSRADNRPALQMALDQACRHRAPLVVYSLSRLARSTKDAIAIAERLDIAGADLVSLSEAIDTTSAAGKMVFRMLAVLAEFERDLVSERTRLALAHKRLRGEKTGGRVPFGYLNRGGRLVPIEQEQHAIRRGLAWQERGVPLRTIAERWQQHGYTNHRMTAKTVAGILRRHRDENSGFVPDRTNGNNATCQPLPFNP